MKIVRLRHHFAGFFISLATISSSLAYELTPVCTPLAGGSNQQLLPDEMVRIDIDYDLTNNATLGNRIDLFPPGYLTHNLAIYTGNSTTPTPQQMRLAFRWVPSFVVGAKWPNTDTEITSEVLEDHFANVNRKRPLNPVFSN